MYFCDNIYHAGNMFQIYYATAAVNIFRQLLLYLRNIYIPRYKPVYKAEWERLFALNPLPGRSLLRVIPLRSINYLYNTILYGK